MATIWRLSDPAAFARLRSTRQRARTDALWLAHAAPLDPAIPPRVAFAISRKVGGAVVRNRIRRRLRAALLAVELPAGDYLVGATPAAAHATWIELNQQVSGMIRSISSRRPAELPLGSA